MNDDEIGDVLRNQAEDILRRHADVRRALQDTSESTANGVHVLQFLEHPSFDPPSVLNVWKKAKRRQAPTYSVARTMDGQTTQAALDPDRFDSLYQRLCSQSLPSLLPPHMVGCDGVGYELALGDTWLGWRLNWWVRLPEEWGELGLVIDEMVTFLRDSFALSEHDA